MNIDQSNTCDRNTPEKIRDFVLGASMPNDKKPLYRSLAQATDFPIHALGEMTDPIIAIQQITQAPIEIVAQSVLAAITLAVQAQRDVMLPGGGCKPLTGFYVSIADSGERKTTVDKLALAAVYEVEKKWLSQYQKAQQDYSNELEAWENIRNAAKRKRKGSVQELCKIFDEIGLEPTKPPHPMLLVADPTPEALILHLDEGRPFAGVFTAEGGLLIGGAAFSNDSKMRTAALFNTLWDGEPIRRKRVGTGSSFLIGRRCSAHIMLQPIVANDFFGEALFEGIGLIARMLIVAPQSTAGTRIFKEPPPETVAILEKYNIRLKFLLERPFVTSSESSNVLEPPVMELSHEAKMVWISFYNDCEAGMSNNGFLFPIRAFASKLAEHAGRIAAIMSLFENPDTMVIDRGAMVSGVELAQYYAHEMLRLQDGATISASLRSAQRLLTWWQGLETDIISLATIYQLGPSNLRDAKAARNAVETLVDHGWVAQMPAGTIIDNKPRKEVWNLLP